ncbi:hypothetical protein EV421DRAFT_1731698 [Armillaria borealis]|uniref:Auxin efflux carrier n=1 Tax=Armillaria borealis TaxID=47425 RepID=A0AA39JZR8_9AGAR|nr:hypothetical protein EV421DRAFT_1731698 [Armillaria borealis]
MSIIANFESRSTWPVDSYSAVLIREFCYVPRNFWAGILVATALSNWTSLPTAVVLTVAEQRPFDSNTDPQRAAKTLAWDYAPGVPQGDAANVRVGWREKPVAAFFLRVQAKLFARLKDNSDCEKADDEKETKDKALSIAMGKQPESDLEEMETDPEIQPAHKTLRLFANSFLSAAVSAHPCTGSILPAMNAPHPPLRELPDTAVQSSLVTDEQEFEPVEEEKERLGCLASLFPPLLRRMFKPLSSLFTPIMMSMYIAIPISLIPQLKALFVEVDSGPSYHGPDGNPPLTFIITTGKFLMYIFVSNGYPDVQPSFVGNMNIPMTLILLGASFARMKIPRPFTKMPLPALFWVSFCKLAFLPVIGVVPKEALVERFVAMLLSGTPSAVRHTNRSLVATICPHVHFYCNYNCNITFTPIDSGGDQCGFDWPT